MVGPSSNFLGRDLDREFGGDPLDWENNLGILTFQDDSVWDFLKFTPGDFEDN